MTHGEFRAEPILKGKRVLLRLGRPSDARAILDFFLDNRAHFKPTDPPRPPNFYSEDYWVERVATTALEYHQDRSCHLFVFAGPREGTLIGYANLSNFIRGAFQACYLGYGLAAEAQGKGLMSEALGLAIQFAFEELRLHRIMANYLPTNERSARVLERLGFKKEGYAPDYLFINGGWRDHVLTALTNTIWRPPG